MLNTLNTIAGLVTEEPAEARTLIATLGDPLAGHHAGSRRSHHTVREEVSWLRFARILESRHFWAARVRMGRGRLGGGLRAPAMPLALLENAVHHGALRRREGGRVVLQITGEAGHLRCAVEDEAPASTGRCPAGGRGGSRWRCARRPGVGRRVAAHRLSPAGRAWRSRCPGGPHEAVSLLRRRGRVAGAQLPRGVAARHRELRTIAAVTNVEAAREALDRIELGIDAVFVDIRLVDRPGDTSGLDFARSSRIREPAGGGARHCSGASRARWVRDGRCRLSPRRSRSTASRRVARLLGRRRALSPSAGEPRLVARKDDRLVFWTSTACWRFRRRSGSPRSTTSTGVLGGPLAQRAGATLGDQVLRVHRNWLVAPAPCKASAGLTGS